MSDYTITVLELEENGFDFGLNDYEIFNEEYRPILNRAILDYYQNYEIAYINPWQWRERLRTRMDLIMRNKYNSLYEAKTIDFNPLYNIEIHETFEREVNGDSKKHNSGTTTSDITTENNIDNTSKNTSKNTSITSQYPSEALTQGDLTKSIYANAGVNSSNEEAYTQKNNTRNVSSGIDTGENTETQEDTQKEVYKKTTQGSSAGLPFSKAMIQLKDYFSKFDLDLQVIQELKDLFILIF